MKTLYEKYKKIKIEGTWIGLAFEDNDQYFCTPIGAKVIGWDNGIHYCFIEGFGDMVFCVNPESCCDYYVYPVAKNFYDFLSLILATQNTNSMQQVILWDKQTFESFMNNPENIEYAAKKEVTDALNTIRMELGVMPMEKPFEYIKELQRGFPYEHICFSNEYYDTLGLERPDGTEADENGFEFDAVEFRFEKK